MGNRPCPRCHSAKWFWRETGAAGYCNLCSEEDGTPKAPIQSVHPLPEATRDSGRAGEVYPLRESDAGGRLARKVPRLSALWDLLRQLSKRVFEGF